VLEGADVLVVSAGTPGQFAGAAGAGRRGIYILHTYPHGRRQHFIGRWIMRAAFKSVREIVAVSAFQKSEMTRLWRLGQRGKSVEVIRNTAGDPLVSDERAEQSPLVVMTASWLEPYKEPLAWLQVANSVSQTMGPGQVRFVWFGEGSMLATCREAASKLPDGVDIDFVGHRDDLADAYLHADVYLQISSTENMSLSVIEALRYGIPAVCTNVGGLPEIEIDGLTGFVVAVHDHSAAVNAVRSLLVDSELRREMSLAARLRYQRGFSYEIWLAKMLTLHTRVLNSKQAKEVCTFRRPFDRMEGR